MVVLVSSISLFHKRVLRTLSGALAGCFKWVGQFLLQRPSGNIRNFYHGLPDLLNLYDMIEALLKREFKAILEVSAVLI